MFSDLEKDEKKKEEEPTGAFEDVSLSIENENFDLESCVPLKTIKREEGLQSEIMELRNKLKTSEYRGEQAEMNIQRLNVRIDQTEEDLLAEKMKIKRVSDELNQTFDDMLNMSV